MSELLTGPLGPQTQDDEENFSLSFSLSLSDTRDDPIPSLGPVIAVLTPGRYLGQRQ